MDCDDIQFTCGHCGAEVPWPDRAAHNACPECNWSKHVTFGNEKMPPCGAMMKPFLPGDGSVVHRCTGCGFMMQLPTEAAIDAWTGTGEAFKDEHTAFGTITYYDTRRRGEPTMREHGIDRIVPRPIRAGLNFQ